MAYAQMLNRTAMLHPAMASPACLATVGTRVPKLTSCTCLGAGRRYFAASRQRQLQSAKRFSTAHRVLAMGLPTTSPPSGGTANHWPVVQKYATLVHARHICPYYRQDQGLQLCLQPAACIHMLVVACMSCIKSVRAGPAYLQ